MDRFYIALIVSLCVIILGIILGIVKYKIYHYKEDKQQKANNALNRKVNDKGKIIDK